MPATEELTYICDIDLRLTDCIEADRRSDGHDYINLAVDADLEYQHYIIMINITLDTFLKVSLSSYIY